MCDGLKDILYHPVKFDSRNMEKFGNAIGWDWLEQEGNKNVDNPGRAVGKAAAAAASWYLGGLLGAGAGAGANAAGQTAAEVAAQEAAKQLAEQAALEAAKQGAATGAEGLLSQVPQGLGNTMESALMDSGYTPSSIFQAFKNAGGSTPLNQNLANYGKELMMKASNGGLLNTLSSNMGDKQSQMMMKMGSGMMSPEQPQQMPMSPPPRQQGPQEPLPNPYGQGLLNSMDGPPPGMTWEEWEKMKRMKQGLMGRM